MACCTDVEAQKNISPLRNLVQLHLADAVQKKEEHDLVEHYTKTKYMVKYLGQNALIKCIDHNV